MEENKYLFTSKIDDRSRITIPKEILDKSKIKVNSTVVIGYENNNTICIRPKK
jgi:AbrB family looped-hinge helix DNA binding protein